MLRSLPAQANSKLLFNFVKNLIYLPFQKIKSALFSPLFNALKDTLGVTSLDNLLSRNYRWTISSIKHSNSTQGLQLLPPRWSVISQFNEDSIINQCLLDIVTSHNTSKLAIEFGSGGYSSNVALTAATFNLRVLMVDASRVQLNRIKKTITSALRLVPNARNNITYVLKLLNPSTISQDISELIGNEIPVLASVDIDSFDELIIRDLMDRNVPIIVAEYNSCFGPDAVISDFNEYSSHNMVAIEGNQIPAFGVSFKYLLNIARAKNYFCFAVEENGVNMVLVHNSYSSSFNNIDTPVYRRNVLYPYILPKDFLSKLEDRQ